MSYEYRQLKKEDAKFLFDKYKQSEAVDPGVIESKITGKISNEKSEILSKLIHDIKELSCKSKLLNNKNKGTEAISEQQNFDTEVSILTHRYLSPDIFTIEELNDIDFWRVLTFIEDATLASVIDMRYGALSENGEYIKGSAMEEHYHLGRITAGYISRQWTRAEISYNENNPEDPYQITRIRKDADIWDSHILRQNFGSCKHFASAFVKFCADKDLPGGNPESVNVISHRDLASELKRRFASSSYETMSLGEAYKFIESVWRDGRIWKSSIINDDEE